MSLSGRATLIWAVVLYAIAQICFTVTMEEWLPVAFRSLLRAKWQQLNYIAAQNPDRPLMVMLGSSRTEYALQADRMNDLVGPDGKQFIAYNYGLPSLGPLYAGLSLREMLDAGIRPRLLVVEYLPPLLNEPVKGLVSEEAWTAASWLNLRQLVRLWPYFKHPDQKARDWFEARVAPWYVFRREAQAAINGQVHPDLAVKITVPYDPWGRKPQEVTSAAEKQERSRIAYGIFHDSLGHLRVGKGPSRSLHDVLDICRREHIRLVIVSMPESTTFRSWYSPAAAADIEAHLAELREKEGADVIDAKKWLADDQFVDGHHVTEEGSRTFSTRLHDELQHLLTKKGRAPNNAVAIAGRQ
jgi:hypothetical protein